MLDENIRLLVFLSRSRRLVRRQIHKLALWRDLNPGDPSVIACDRRIVSLERERARLSAEIAVVENADERLEPPDAAQEQQVAGVTQQVDDLIAQQAAADAILALSATVLQTAQAVRGVPDEAG